MSPTLLNLEVNVARIVAQAVWNEIEAAEAEDATEGRASYVLHYIQRPALRSLYF